MTRRFFDDDFTNAVNTDSRRRILAKGEESIKADQAISLSAEQPDCQETLAESDATDQIEWNELHHAPFDFEPMHILGADQPGILAARLGAPSAEQFPGLKSCSFFDDFTKRC